MLHRRLLDGDAVAPSDLTSAYLDALIRFLGHIAPTTEEAICVQAAEDAVLSLIKNPASCRVGASLWKYLRMSAEGDLKNALARENRRRKRNVSIDSVEHGSSAGKYPSSESEPATKLIEAEVAEELRTRVLPCVRRGLTEAESSALDLLLQGERRTEAYAALLGIGERLPNEQRVLVKQLKDKLKARLKRCREEGA